MRQLGAAWWNSEHEWFLDMLDENNPSRKPTYLHVGWPSTGGVWVLKISGPNADSEASDLGTGRIHNAYDMDEKSAVIKKLGGVFYNYPQDCPDLDLVT